MTRHLLDALATTGPMAEVFSDQSVLQALLDVEVALARAQAETGMIPASAVDAIACSARAPHFDAATIAAAARGSASIVVPLVEALTSRVRDVDETAARFVHWGATSQDLLDTAMSLLVLRARETWAQDHARLSAALGDLSERHKGDVMLARTLLQPAAPTTFGLKVATWFAAERRSWRGLDQTAREAAALQFGGAAGTLASLGDAGPAVGGSLARHLGLPAPAVHWQTDRNRIAALVAGCGLYCGALGKMARDVSLLMQVEVGEVSERGGPSSAMPHKRNPAGSAIVLAAATRLPGLVAASLTGLVHEHERGVGGWHAEWPTLADALQTTGSALEASRDVIEGLTVDPARMRANLDAMRGAGVSERLAMLLAPTFGRDRAQALVRDVLTRAAADGLSPADAVGAVPDARDALSAEDLRSLDDPTAYLGQAEPFRQRLLAED